MEGSTIATMYMEALAEHYHFSLDTPIRDLSPELVDILLYGTKGEKIKVHRKSEYGRGTYETEFEASSTTLSAVSATRPPRGSRRKSSRT